jgi:hypothetical protein
MLALTSEQRIDGDALRNGVPALRAFKRSDFKTGTSRHDAHQLHFCITPRTTLALYRGERDKRILFARADIVSSPQQLFCSFDGTAIFDSRPRRAGASL